MADGSIIIETKMNNTGFEKSLARLTSLAAKGAAALYSAIAGAGTAAIKVGSDFEAGMSKVEALSGAAGAELDALTAKAEEMGAKTQFSASQSAEAMKYMAQAGWDAGQMMNGIGGIMDLAAASGENLASVSDIVTDALTAFGLQASDSAHFADVLAQAAASSNTNVSLMGNTFKYVAPLAGAMGYSIEDTAVAIGVLANAGIKGEQAGTSLRTMLTRLADPPKDAAKAIERLNISITNADGTMKPLSSVIQQLRGAFAGLSKEQKISTASAIAGQDAMSGLLAIVNAGQGDLDKLSESIKNAGGAAAKMAATMNDNLQGKLKILGSSLESLSIKIYKKFEQPLKKAVESATKNINNLTKSVSDGRLSSSIDKIADGASRLITYVSDRIATLLPVLIDGLAILIDNGNKIIAVLSGIGAGQAAFKIASDLQNVIAGWQAATLQIHLYAMGATGAAFKQGILNGQLTLSQVIVGALSRKIGLATAAQAIWNATVMAHPLVALAVAIGAIVGGLALWISTQNESIKALEEQNEAIQEQKKSWDDLKQSCDANAESSVAEVAHVQDLWREFQTLIGAQGKVIKDKERAKALSEEINKIAPNSIKWLDEETIAYEENAGAISKLLEQKKVKARLDAMEPAYQEAIVNKQKLEAEQAELYLKILEKQAEFRKYQASGDQFGMAKIRDEIDLLTDSYRTNEEVLKGYYTTIQSYETGTEAYHGNIRVMKEWISEVDYAYKKVSDITREEGQNQANIAYANWKLMEERFASGTDGVTKQMVEAARKQYRELSTEYKNTWGELPNVAASSYSQNSGALISALDGTGQNVLNSASHVGSQYPQGIANGINSGQSAVTEAANGLTNKLDTEFHSGGSKGMISYSQGMVGSFGVVNGAMNQVGEQINITATGIGAGMFPVGASAIGNYASGVLSGKSSVVASVESISNEAASKAAEGGSQMMQSAAEGVSGAAPQLADANSQAVSDAIRQAEDTARSDAPNIGSNVMEGAASGAEKNKGSLIDAIVGAARSALDAVKSLLGIESPSKVFRDEVGKNMVLGMEQGFTRNTAEVYRRMQAAVDAETARFTARASVAANYTIAAQTPVSAAPSSASGGETVIFEPGSVVCQINPDTVQTFDDMAELIQNQANRAIDIRRGVVRR